MTALSVLLVTENGSVSGIVAAALRPWHDVLDVTHDAADAMERSARNDVVLIDLTVQGGGGLALLHFLHARDPGIAIIAMVPTGDSEADGVAHALGVSATVPLPLTGDELLTVLSPLREKKAAAESTARVPKARPEQGADLTPVLNAQDLHELAGALATVCAAITGGSARVVLEDGRGGEAHAHAGGEEARNTRELTARDEPIGMLYLSHPVEGSLELDRALAAAGALAVALRKADSSAREGIKDPETSAYTFAYFVDVAGREIERARRYDRRFGLLTFTIDNYAELNASASPTALRESMRELVDTILDTVRDSDVLAHVEADEFYLLLPETGRLGALACRRRITEKQSRRAELARLEDRPALAVALGVASFPRDGRDLTTLLFASQKRGRVVQNSAIAAVRSGATLDAVLGALLRVRPEEQLWQVRQSALASEVLTAMAQAVARESTRPGTDGVLYISGDRGHPLVKGALDGLRGVTNSATPAYWLRPRTAEGRTETPFPGRASFVEIEIDGARVGPFALLVVLTEQWAYACVASEHGAYKRAIHTGEIEVVEGLVAQLQSTFHLQRGTE